jgi:hypothetical protein
MNSSVFMPSRPMQSATRFRMPVGTLVRASMICADAEVYTKGTTVFADRVDGAAARPSTLGITGLRSWSPPV